MIGGLAPAWYIIRSEHILARWVNAVHIPYTALHLSFVVMGFSLAPTLHLERSIAVLVAFFLGMSIGSHALDLLAGDPLKLSLPRRHLKIAAVLGIGLAIAIGTYYTATLGIWWYFCLIAFGGVLAVAYNLELFGGRLHTEHWFAFSWGAFPFAAAYLINYGAITKELVLGMIFCYIISRLQDTLSTRARLVRRRVTRMLGWYRATDGKTCGFTRAWLIGPLEKALMWLSISVPVLAVLLVLWRQ